MSENSGENLIPAEKEKTISSDLISSDETKPIKKHSTDIASEEQILDSDLRSEVESEAREELEKAQAEAQKIYDQDKKIENQNEPGKIIDKKQKPSRRGFFRMLAGLAGLTGLEASSRMLNPILPSEKIDPEFHNMVHIDAKEAQYNIVYSSHLIKNNPETLRDADAAILEKTMNSFDAVEDVPAGDPLGFQKDALESMERKDVQYGDLIKFAREKQKPIFLVDISIRGEEKLEIDREMLLKRMAMAIEGILGGIALEKYVPKKIEKMKESGINRRDFLKTAAVATGSLYLLTPVSEAASNLMSTVSSVGGANEHALSRKAGRMLGSINKNIHPETQMPNIVDVRNTLMAQKSEMVAKLLQQELGRKPSTNIYIGAAHTGIEKELVLEKEIRLNALQKAFGDDLKNERFILRINFKKDNEGTETVELKLIEDSELAS